MVEWVVMGAEEAINLRMGQGGAFANLCPYHMIAQTRSMMASFKHVKKFFRCVARSPMLDKIFPNAMEKTTMPRTLRPLVVPTLLHKYSECSV